MDNLRIIDENRSDEGLSKSVRQSLEDIVKRITRGESPCITLTQSDIGGSYE